MSDLLILTQYLNRTSMNNPFFLAYFLASNALIEPDFGGFWLERHVLIQESAFISMQTMKKLHLLGVKKSQHRHFSCISRENPAKTWMIINFQTVRFSHSLMMDHSYEIDATLFVTAYMSSPQCPWWIFSHASN
jgi:hypothetical protein